MSRVKDAVSSEPPAHHSAPNLQKPSVFSALEDSVTLSLSEDVALSLLKNKELASADIDQIAGTTSLLQSRKVQIALVSHPRASRRLAFRILRRLHIFDLMRIAMLPTLPGDLKRTADELLVSRMASVTLGEQISLARRGSATVAAALILAKEPRVFLVALDNGRLNEAAIVKAIALPAASPSLIGALCRHPKWSARQEIRIALLRNAKTPLGRALEFAGSLPPAIIRDLLHGEDLPEKVRKYLSRERSGD